jgi:hypothetical protein
VGWFSQSVRVASIAAEKRKYFSDLTPAPLPPPTAPEEDKKEEKTKDIYANFPQYFYGYLTIKYVVI